MDTIGARFKYLRGAMTQTQMAALFGVKQNTYSSWETDNKEPSLTTVRKVCKHFNIQSDWLICLIDQKVGVEINIDHKKDAENLRRKLDRVNKALTHVLMGVGELQEAVK